MQKTCYLDLSVRNWWRSKNRSKELFGSIKNQGSSKERRETEGSSFEKVPFLEPEEIRGEECSQLLVKLYNNNTL